MENPTAPQPDSTEPSQPDKKVICPNCEKRISRKAVFCPKCGQKQMSGKIKMSDLLIRLWNTTFHLESRFLRMVWHLLIPAKVTTAYFQGKIKRYPHPIQFFLLCMFFFLLYVSGKNKSSPDFNFFNLMRTNSTETIKGKVEMAESLVQHWDSIPQRLRTPVAREALDTLLHTSMSDLEYWEKDSMGIMQGFHFAKDHSYQIANRDLISMTPDSLLDYYHIEHWLDRLLIRQSIRTSHEPAAMGRFWIGSFTWIILFQITMMAFWLKLMYRRQKRYYVEHFVLLIHLHSGFIFLLTVISAMRTYLHADFIPRSLSLWWLAIATPLTLYFYYGQSKRKTLLKFVIFTFLYALMLLFAMIFSLLVSFLFF